MPLQEFKCSAEHITEKYFAKRDMIPAKIRCKTCSKQALAVEFSRTFHRVVFGSAFAYSGPSDRLAWAKDYNVQGFHADEHRARKNGGPVIAARDKLK